MALFAARSRSRGASALSLHRRDGTLIGRGRGIVQQLPGEASDTIEWDSRCGRSTPRPTAFSCARQLQPVDTSVSRCHAHNGWPWALSQSMPLDVNSDPHLRIPVRYALKSTTQQRPAESTGLSPIFLLLQFTRQTSVRTLRSRRIRRKEIRHEAWQGDGASGCVRPLIGASRAFSFRKEISTEHSILLETGKSRFRFSKKQGQRQLVMKSHCFKMTPLLMVNT